MKILSFSGGKDSLAILYLLENEWEQLTIVWVNTGAYLQEDISRCEKIRSMVPNFVEIKTDQRKQIEEKGFPVDLLPVRNEKTVQYLTGEQKPLLQSFINCCAENISLPLHNWAKNNGVKEIIRGQKNTDKMKSAVRDGDVIDGITYRFPIDRWSDQQVIDYLGERLPENYKYMNGGMDCWNCTAYLHDGIGKIKYLEKHHPEKSEQLKSRLLQIKRYVDEDYSYMTGALNGFSK